MILHVNNLSKSFHQAGTNIEVLRKLNLQIEVPQTVAIVGQSGSGKSTLLSMLAGLDRPTSGSVVVHDHDLTKLDERELARYRAGHLSIVFQQFHLLGNLTALENVSLPLEIAHNKEAQELAKQALEQVGLMNRAEHFPSQLSGGECQRVAIARALVVKPVLLLADEPSGNLDARTGEQVMSLLFDLAVQRETTLLLVTHNEALAARCQRQLTLRDGQLIEETQKGTP